MNYRRGDTVLVLFPDSNWRTSKRRPVLVVQADQLGTGLSQTIVATITSNMARAGDASRVVVQTGSASASGSGLLMDSVIMTDNLATIQDSEIDRVIGVFSGMARSSCGQRWPCRSSAEPQARLGGGSSRRSLWVLWPPGRHRTTPTSRHSP